MKTDDIIQSGFAMPLHSPAYPREPYRFINREYMVIPYRTDPEKLRALVPELLQIDDASPLVHFEFIRMPDSAGFGDYTEAGQVIPVMLDGRKSNYIPAMYLDSHAPVSARHMLADLDLGAGQVVYDYLSRGPVTAGKEKRV